MFRGVVGVILCTCLALAPVATPTVAAAVPDPAQVVPGYVVKRWTTTEGLPHNSILSLVQTRDGYLWIGTARGGLARFDGVAFTTFNLLNTPELGSDSISALHEDAAGTLWIGTYGGLVTYRDGRFVPVPLDQAIHPGVITGIESDRDGALWVAGAQRVLRRAGDAWSVIATGAIPIAPLSPAPDGTMWIGTTDGLVEWRAGIVRTITTADGLPSPSIFAVHEDRGGLVWIGTARGVVHFDRRAVPARLERTILAREPIGSIYEETGGRLWFGGDGKLFGRAPDGTLLEAAFGDPAGSEHTRVFTMDREGHLWFGVTGGAGGLYRLDRRRVTTLAGADTLPCDNVGPITQAADGTIWLATLCTDGRGLVALRDGKATLHPGPAYISSLLAEADGTLWVGAYGGALWRLAGDGFEQVPSPAHEARADILAIHRHRDGALWLGTSRGLFRFHGDDWEHLRASNSPIDEAVHALASDRDGALWIGFAGQLGRYLDGRFTYYGATDGLPPGAVRALHVDADGAIWIGTYGGGLALFDRGRFTAFGARDGLLDTSVHRIIDDGTHLWMTGDRGIRRVSKADLRAIAGGRATALAATTYAEADGMQTAECNGMGQPAGWRMRDGALLIPTQRGAVRLDPVVADRSDLPVPLPQIEGIIVDGDTLSIAADGAADALPPSTTDEGHAFRDAGMLVVPAGYRDVEIRYTAPALARAEQVQFRYRLDGYDKEWRDVGTRRVASFVSPPPGRYRFLVAARNGGGPWSETPVAVTLLLEPHVYQRRSFQIGVLALAIAAMVVFARARIARVRRRADDLERAVASRTAELSVAHERLSLAHDDVVRAKQQVEQAHDQVLAVLRQLDIGVLLLSATGAVRHVGAAAQRVLRRDEQALIGHMWWTCLPLVEADRARLKARFEASRSFGERVPVQMVIDGTRYWMEIDVRDEPPPGVGRILYMYDVTELAVPSEGGLSDGDIVGRSTAMQLLRWRIRDLARVDSTVLIEGETGVGKELVARAIHQGSPRASRPFVAVNAAGLSESLLASQLFGHRRGAFTGAIDDQQGLFEAANGGTLFLDEIGDMPVTVQASLLRVLQEREITRVGESQARRIDVRILAATHRDLKREVEDGRFREDLLYRIRVATITVPPLRDRVEDVPVLVDAFLTRTARGQGRPATPQMTRDAVVALMRHPWPGNVRELESVIERSLLNASGDIIGLEDLPPEVAGRPPVREDAAVAADPQSERDRLADALRRTKGNRAQAARLLGIGRTTLYKRLAEFGLLTDVDD